MVKLDPSTSEMSMLLSPSIWVSPLGLALAPAPRGLGGTVGGNQKSGKNSPVEGGW